MNPTTKVDAGLAIGDFAQSSATPPRAVRSHAWIAWIPLAALPLAALTLRSVLPAWIFMWLLAIAIFAGFKWQTWWDVSAARHSRNWSRTLAYLLLWPGMDADEFFEPGVAARRIAPSEWIVATVKTFLGVTMIGAACKIVSTHPMAAGWIAMIGLVVALHFGAFQLMALAWQHAGIHARSIMRRPLQSESLGELWGKRWNLGFRKLSHGLVFRPVQKRLGAVAATLGAFLASGLIHDLVISVPARAGYGLPTVYFLLQGIGVLAERSLMGRRLGLGHGTRGRAWTAFVALGPVFILFHPWFVMRVMVPFLRAIG